MSDTCSHTYNLRVLVNVIVDKDRVNLSSPRCGVLVCSRTTSNSPDMVFYLCLLGRRWILLGIRRNPFWNRCPCQWQVFLFCDATLSFTGGCVQRDEIQNVSQKNWKSCEKLTLWWCLWNIKIWFWSASFISGPEVCRGVMYGIRPIVACLPAWFRFAQCIRRYRDTKLFVPHIVNAGKYSTTFFVVLFSSLNTFYKRKLQVQLLKGHNRSSACSCKHCAQLSTSSCAAKSLRCWNQFVCAFQWNMGTKWFRRTSFSTCGSYQRSYPLVTHLRGT